MFPHEEYLQKALIECNNNIIVILQDLMALYVQNAAIGENDVNLDRAIKIEKIISDSIDKFPPKF